LRRKIANPDLPGSAASKYLGGAVQTVEGAVEFCNALVKADGSAVAQLIMEQGQGHYPDFNYIELESPVSKLLNATIGPGAWGVRNARHNS
jgi:hypothetical protein